MIINNNYRYKIQQICTLLHCLFKIIIFLFSIMISLNDNLPDRLHIVFLCIV